MSRASADMRAARPILIMAGGTGGHVFPALAVALALRAQGFSLAWLGTRRGLEARLVPQHGIPLRCISVSGLRGNGLLSWLLAPLKLSLALLQSLWVVLQLRPRAVLGMGGFATGPGGLASWLLRRPLVIHEQNAVAGLTNRLLARLTDRKMQAFPGGLPGPSVRLTGNPVRAEIGALQPPETRLAERRDAPRLLVLGGSQGARAINELLPAALGTMAAASRPDVWHQTGPRLLEATRAQYGALSIDARVEPFIADIAQAYGWADLALCRAGALTVSELAVAGLGAILVPYPYAVDDHQTRNAAFLVEAGAAVVVQEADLAACSLAALLGELSGDRERLLDMARRARSLGRPQATDEVARICAEAANG